MVEHAQIFCFGEVLWDVLESEELPGGAPLNVAYHLAKDKRYHVSVISSVGKDEAGDEMLSLMHGWGIDTRFVQRSEQFPTGKVLANTADKENVTYEILAPVAWDDIREDEQLRQDRATGACLVYGSLACRSEMSRHTLFKLLSNGTFNVFDVNLRGTFYDGVTLAKLLDYTDLLKINEEELAEIIRIFYPDMAGAAEDKQLEKLMTRFWIDEAIVTRGATGATHYSAAGSVNMDGVPVIVADTIGSGDAFLAGFLRYRLAGVSLRDALANAVAMGAFNAQLKGGCPAYALDDFDAFKATKNI